MPTLEEAATETVEAWDAWFDGGAPHPDNDIVNAIEQQRQVLEAECSPPSMAVEEYVKHYYQGNYPERA